MGEGGVVFKTLQGYCGHPRGGLKGNVVSTEQFLPLLSHLHIILCMFSRPSFPAPSVFNFLIACPWILATVQVPYILSPFAPHFLCFLKFHIHKRGLELTQLISLGQATFIHSFIKYLWNTWYMQGTLLGAGVKVVEETNKNVCCQSLHSTGHRQDPKLAIPRPDATFQHHHVWLAVERDRVMW